MNSNATPDTEGAVAYSINVSDSLGNAATPVTGGGVMFDRTPPVVTPVTMLSNNAGRTGFAKTGNNITITFTATDTRMLAPVGEMSGTIATKATTVASTGGSNYTSVYTPVLVGDAQGSAAYEIVVKDMAGNVTTRNTGIAVPVVIDTAVPTISALAISSNHTANGLTAWAKDGDIITADITADGTGTAVTGSTATIAGQPATATATTVTYSVPTVATVSKVLLPDGLAGYSVVVTDAAGNNSAAFTTGATGGVTIDRTAPTLSAASFVSSYATHTDYAKAGDTVTLTLSSSDGGVGMTTPPVVAMTSGSVAINGTITQPVIGADKTSTYEMNSNATPDTEGAVAYSINVSDSLGNAATEVTGGGVTFDRTEPTVSITSPANNAFIDATDTMTLTVSDGTVTAKIGSETPAAYTSGTTAISSLAGWAAIDESGAVAVTVYTTDLAGNEGTATRSFKKDTTRPTTSLTSPAAPVYPAATATAITAGSTGPEARTYFTTGTSISFTWAGADLDSTISGYKVDAAFTSDTDGAATIILNTGATYAITAVDIAGNSSYAMNITVTQDPNKPTVGITTPAASATIVGAIAISGTVSDVGSNVAKVEYQLSVTKSVTQWWSSSESPATNENDIYSAAHGYANGTLVHFSGSTLPSGIDAETAYFVINTETDRFQVSLSLNGSAVPLGNANNTGSGLKVMKQGSTWNTATPSGTNWTGSITTSVIAAYNATIVAKSTDNVGNVSLLFSRHINSDQAAMARSSWLITNSASNQSTKLLDSPWTVSAYTPTSTALADSSSSIAESSILPSSIMPIAPAGTTIPESPESSISSSFAKSISRSLDVVKAKPVGDQDMHSSSNPIPTPQPTFTRPAGPTPAPKVLVAERVPTPRADAAAPGLEIAALLDAKAKASDNASVDIIMEETVEKHSPTLPLASTRTVTVVPVSYSAAPTQNSAPLPAPVVPRNSLPGSSLPVFCVIPKPLEIKRKLRFCMKDE